MPCRPSSGPSCRRDLVVCIARNNTVFSRHGPCESGALKRKNPPKMPCEGTSARGLWVARPQLMLRCFLLSKQSFGANPAHVPKHKATVCRSFSATVKVCGGLLDFLDFCFEGLVRESHDFFEENPLKSFFQHDDLPFSELHAGGIESLGERAPCDQNPSSRTRQERESGVPHGPKFCRL